MSVWLRAFPRWTMGLWLWDMNVILSNIHALFFWHTKENKRTPRSFFELNASLPLSFPAFLCPFTASFWFSAPLSLSLLSVKRQNHTFFHNANTCAVGVRKKSCNIIFLLRISLLKQENQSLFSHISWHSPLLHSHYLFKSPLLIFSPPPSFLLSVFSSLKV